MKRIFLFIYLSISMKASEPMVVNINLEEVLMHKQNNFVDINIEKPIPYVKSDLPSKLSFKLDGNCIERFGENFYDARAGISYLFTSVIGFETGYELVPTRMDTLGEINSKYIGLYGRFVFKF